MDVQAYILSGIIEDYCLGLLSVEDISQVEQNAALYPVVRMEIQAFRRVLEHYVLPHTVPVPDALKDKVIGLINNLAKERSGGTELPLINKYSHRESWLRIVKPLLPETPPDGFFGRMLRNDERVFQTIIWSSHDIPDEVHTDTHESFIVLEGECECCLGDEIIKLGPGGFLEIPLHTRHSVKTFGEPVLAVVQRLQLA
ncbi:MAG TPA: cupin domain-containing protein [Chitinophagaceae bacterium]|jgi:mannose-6-phosphate isomerase-like protein (cupin superfamily)